MTSDKEEFHPGPLHNLTLHIQVNRRESFYIFSSHQIRLPSASNSVVQSVQSHQYSQSSSSRSQTPSPQKVQRMKYAQLEHWNIRVCQTIDHNQPLEEEGSSTEDESERPQNKNAKVKARDDPNKVVVAWYSFQLKAEDAPRLVRQQTKAKKWEELEVQLRFAWESGSINVLGREDVQEEDGMYEEIRLQFGLKRNGGKAGTPFPSSQQSHIKRETSISREMENQDEETIQIDLKRANDEIQQASDVAIELMKALGTLKTKAQSLERERNSSRKLIHDNRKHERYHEPSASLINPGRIKRKLQDDSGFEGEEEEG